MRQLYDQATNLKVSMQEYNKLLQSQKTLSLLNKALENGQLSMIEYFIEANQVYESMQNGLTTRKPISANRFSNVSIQVVKINKKLRYNIKM